VNHINNIHNNVQIIDIYVELISLFKDEKFAFMLTLILTRVILFSLKVQIPQDIIINIK